MSLKFNYRTNTIESTAGTDLTITPLAGQQLILDSVITVDAGSMTGITTLGFDGVSLTAIQTSGEGFADNDTSIMTSAAIDDRILSYGYTTNTGTVTSVGITAGTLIDVTGSPVTGSGSITVDVDLSEATEAVFAPATDYVLFLDGGVTGTAAKEAWTDFATSIAGSGITATSGVLSADTSGTVTSVAAGNGMDFTTITATGSVTMGTPGSLSSSSTNAVTATSHTHAITSIDAADIAAGSLATGVNPYFTASATASAFKIPFMNYTGTTSTNASILFDSGASEFTYNPSTNTLTVGALALTTALDETDGGTGQTTYAAGDILYASAANTLSKLAAGTNTHVLTLSGGLPTWAAPSAGSVAFNDLTSKTSGTGNYQTSGDFIADNFEATGLGPNTTPGTDDAYFGGYGVLGDRTGTIYVSNVSGAVTLNYGGVHNVNTKLATTSTGVTVTGTVVADGLTLGDNESILLGAGSDIDLAYDSSADAVDFQLSTTADFRVIGGAAGTDGMIIAKADSNVDLYYNGVLALRTTNYTGADAGTGAQVKDGLNAWQPVGMNVLPVYEIDASDTFDLAHNGMMWHKDAGAAVTFTCANDANIPVGATYLVHNDDTEDLTIAQGTGVTIYWLDATGAPASGNVTVSQGGIVTVYKYTDTEFWVWGAKDPITDFGADGTMDSGTDLAWSDASQPWLTLDSTSSGDSWSAQGAGISVGESGKRGSAAIHMTYNGDGSGYLGMGTVDNTASTGGRPTYGHFDFTYNNRNILVGGLLYPGNSAGTTGSSLVQSVAYIESADSQNYGSINVTGAAGSSGTYSGVSVNRRFVMMNNGSTTSGFYNDNNNEWFMTMVENGAITLYNNNVDCARTQTYNTTGNTSAFQVIDHSDVYRDVGFNHVKEVSMTTASITLDDIHAGCIIRRTGSSTVTLTVAAGTAFPNGSMVTVLNHGTGGSLTISDGSEAMYIMDGSGSVTDSTGFALAIGGAITIWRQGTSAYYVWGTGIP